MDKPRPMPTTVEGILEAASDIRRLRAAGHMWAHVSEITGYTRTDAIRLAHATFELIDGMVDETRRNTLVA